METPKAVPLVAIRETTARHVVHGFDAWHDKKENVSLVYRDVWTNSQGRGKTSVLVRVWAIATGGTW